MPKSLSISTLNILSLVKQADKVSIYNFIKEHFKNESYRKIYTHIYQLEKRGYLEKYRHKDFEYIKLSSKGQAILEASKKEKDGKWRAIIFDIPETQRPVRDFLRSKIKQLGFKKWQNSIWISPYVIPPDVEAELLILSEKFFVRLIKIESINNESDLKNLF
jgi:DNA-binding transcriptional regulator PaaX